MTEINKGSAFCVHCMKIQECEIETHSDCFIWRCRECGIACDQEFKDELDYFEKYEEEDE